MFHGTNVKVKENDYKYNDQCKNSIKVIGNRRMSKDTPSPAITFESIAETISPKSKAPQPLRGISEQIGAEVPSQM
jgi:hypothetical protein